MVMNKLFLYTLIFMSLLLSSCKTMDQNTMKPLETVNFVDINRYIGEWYEIARYEHRFQKGCVGSKATYSLRDDGKITVVNECFEKSFSDNIRSAKGKAWVVDKQSNAKLKVSFFWPFSGDYWVIDLGEKHAEVRTSSSANNSFQIRSQVFVVCKPLLAVSKLVAPGDKVVFGEKDPHIR